MSCKQFSIKFPIFLRPLHHLFGTRTDMGTAKRPFRCRCEHYLWSHTRNSAHSAIGPVFSSTAVTGLIPILYLTAFPLTNLCPKTSGDLERKGRIQLRGRACRAPAQNYSLRSSIKGIDRRESINSLKAPTPRSNTFQQDLLLYSDYI